MKKLIVLLPVVLVLSAGILAAFSPDLLTLADVLIMCLVLAAGIVSGLIPLITYLSAFTRAQENVRKASGVQTEAAWVAAFKMERFFGNKTMDRIFGEYRDKVQQQWETGQILSDIEDYINEDVVDSRSWHGVTAQIPGTLTGLGILGTFVGLLVGLRGVAFDTVQAALTSVEGILSGIDVAFYTSISGVILSILYNIGQNITYNIVYREMNLFLEMFHKYVIPTVEEQSRYRARRENRQMVSLLERIPKNRGFSVSNNRETGNSGTQTGTEQILMPQILDGLKNGEFTFYLQPRYELNTRKIVGGDALVRWKHSTLGILSPAVFIPVLERNGYITKLDRYIWEEVCRTLRRWIDSGKRPVPISLNVTKTDILAMDIADFFEGMLEKYRIPPRYLDISISRKAYQQAGSVATEVEKRLQQAGFRVMMDGFDGDYVALGAIGNLNADVLELDLRFFDFENKKAALSQVLDQARQLRLTIFAVGIENAEQLNALRKCGCTEGQGFYFSKPISLEEFEKKMENPE